MNNRAKSIRFVLLLMMLIFHFPLIAKESDRMGEVFAIEEESLEEFIHRSLSKKDINRMLAKAKEVFLEEAKNPPPIQRLGEAKKTKSSILDPTYILKKDLKDEKGKVVAKAGAKINPLKNIKLESGLLFLDGDQKKHIDWARKQKGNFKWILIKGKPFDLESTEKRPIFFDQGGRYTSFFKIKNIPTRIVQQGSCLLVEEHRLEEK